MTIEYGQHNGILRWIRNPFTGFDSPYEEPEFADIHLKTGTMTAEAAAEAVITRIEEKYLSP